MTKKIEGILKNGNLYQIVVVDNEGMAVEAIGNLYDPEMLSALFSSTLRFVTDLKRNLKVNGIEKLSLKIGKRPFKFILRFFKVDGKDFFIIAICHVNCSHSQAMKEIIFTLHEKAKQRPGNNTLQEPFVSFEKAIQGDLDNLFPDSKKEKDEVVVKPEKIKEIGQSKTGEVKKEMPLVEEKSAMVNSNENIGLISSKVAEKLTPGIIEEMVLTIAPRIVEDLVRKEIRRINERN